VFGTALTAGLLLGCGARDGLDASPLGPGRVTAVEVDDDRGCALLSDGEAACWGDVGAAAQRTAEPLAGVSDIASIDGGRGLCGILEDKSLVCWGSVPGLANDFAPTTIGSGFAAVSTSEFEHICALKLDGTAVCWGNADTGQLGDGVMVERNVFPPHSVEGLSDAVALAAGYVVNCAIRASGSVVCWGPGPLGDGTTNPSSTPVAVVGLPGPAKQIAAGFWHACALLEDGTVVCWGAPQGAFGIDPPTTSQGIVPKPVEGLPPAKRVSVGNASSCAVLFDDSVRCWGQLLQRVTGTVLPKPLSGLPRAVSVSLGGLNGCALLPAGRGVECWGENGFGQLGDGTTTPRSLTPVRVVGLP
jgi:alpha-tubulin suppressor-like RCC1 family protein